MAADQSQFCGTFSGLLRGYVCHILARDLEIYSRLECKSHAQFETKMIKIDAEKMSEKMSKKSNLTAHKV